MPAELVAMPVALVTAAVETVWMPAELVAVAAEIAVAVVASAAIAAVLLLMAEVTLKLTKFCAVMRFAFV